MFTIGSSTEWANSRNVQQQMFFIIDTNVPNDIVLKSENGNQSIYKAFEFISPPHKRIEDDDAMKFKPLVYVSYAISTSMKWIKILLQDEKVVVITCAEHVALYLARYFERAFTSSRLIEFASAD